MTKRTMLVWLTAFVAAGFLAGGYARAAEPMPNENPKINQGENTADEGLVGRWELEEGSGTAIKDSSGQSHHGQLAGGEWTQGIVGRGAIRFAPHGRIEIPHDPALKPAVAITIALWVRGSNPWFSGYGQRVLCVKNADGGDAISLNAWRGLISSNLTTRGGAGGTRTVEVQPHAEPAGDITEWHHHAVTYDGTVARLYTDGSLQGASEIAGAIAYGDQPIEVGSENLGAVDDLRIYNRALSQAEIARLAAMGGRSELARSDDRVPEFKRTGWNVKVRQRFMHPPTFTYETVAGVNKYRFSVFSAGRKVADGPESTEPRFDLAVVWDRLPPAGLFTVEAEALDDRGGTLGRKFSSFQRIASFKGPYRPAARGYAESADKVAEWVLKAKPDAKSYPYPVLMYRAYIKLLTAHVKANPKGALAGSAAEMAVQYGQEMLKTSTPADWAYGSLPLSHEDPKMLQPHRAAMGGQGYLELYGMTKDRQWLEAALRIAETLRKTQLPDGRWPWRVEPREGKVLADYTSDQSEALLFFDELITAHGREDLAPARDRAAKWMLENPCKTFLWQHQYEDTNYDWSYSNLEWSSAGLMIQWLLKHADAKNGYAALAADLVRYIEDQFVEWEPCGNEITPGVREQYCCYPVIGGHAGRYINVCLAFHAHTRDEVWLRKARAMADTLTATQHPEGYYPTWMDTGKFRPSKDQPFELKEINYGDNWPNCSAEPAVALLRLGEYEQGTPPRK